MLRKLGIGITALAMVSPGMAVALEVGNHQLNSYLNQPLNMKVDLHDVKGLSADDIIVNLAPQEAYDAAGVDLDYFLTKLEFDLQVVDQNSATLHIRSRDQVVEPYLNFLVEFLWPTGRLMREYTLLLDPPSYADDTQVAAPTVSRAPQPVRRSEPVSQPAPTASPRPQIEASPAGSIGDGERQQYRVSASDTLWQIALDNRPASSMSVQQVLVAIQEMNPDAFINNNVNLVREGAVLRLPNEQDVRRISSRDAITDVAAQNRRWQEMLEAQGRQVVQRPALDGSRQQVDRSTDSAPAERGQVRLLTPDSVAGARDGDAAGVEQAGDADTAALQNELALRDENLDRLDRENSELRSRMADLEEQIETSRQLLSLRSEQIAQLQNELRNLREAEGESVDDDPLLAAIVEPATDLVDADGVAQEADEEGALLLAADETATSDDDDEQLALAPAATDDDGGERDTAAPGAPGDQAVTESGDAVTAAPVIPAPAPQPQTATTGQTGIVALISQNLLYIGAGAAALLLALLLLVRRRKQQEEEAIQAAMAELDEDDEEFGANLDVESSDGAEVAVLAADADNGGAPADGAAQDPLDDVDVYVAYGRYPQAIEFLDKEIDKAPEREDLKVRQLELLKETGDESGFAARAAVFGGSGAVVAAAIARLASDEQRAALSAQSDDEQDDDGELSLDDLALDLSADDDDVADEQERASLLDDEPLLVDEPEIPVVSGNSADEQESFDELADFDFELDESDAEGSLDVAAEQTTAPAVAPAASQQDEDEDIFSFDELEPQAAAEQDQDDRYSLELEQPQSEEGEELDFELSLDDLDDGATASDSDEALDLSLDDLDLDEPAAESVAAEADDGLDDIEFELPDAQADAELDDLAPTTSSEVEPEQPSSEPAAEPATPEPVAAVQPAAVAGADLLEDEDDFDFLGATDENATKLDLAKAYIEMGDAEGARDILNEVIAEGNDEQQAQARELLPKVS